MKRWVSSIVLLTLLAVAIFSLGKIADYCYHRNESKNNIRELISDEDSKGENYRRLKEQNSDLVGWIRTYPQKKIFEGINLVHCKEYNGSSRTPVLGIIIEEMIGGITCEI